MARDGVFFPGLAQPAPALRDARTGRSCCRPAGRIVLRPDRNVRRPRGFGRLRRLDLLRADGRRGDALPAPVSPGAARAPAPSCLPATRSCRSCSSRHRSSCWRASCASNPEALGHRRRPDRRRPARLLRVLRPREATERTRRDARRAPYMEWAKTRPRPEIDLAGSNLLALHARRPARSARGGRHRRREPGRLRAARRGDRARATASTADRVATAAGCSGANFLTCAALLEAGDEVLVERPFYDPLPAAARLLGASRAHLRAALRGRLRRRRRPRSPRR